jgi:signal transduction histidine kinase/ligand-binding sensor domain-containing protein
VAAREYPEQYSALHSFLILPSTNRRTMTHKSILRIFLAGAITATWCAPLPALDVSRKISQYAHAAWRTRDGAFSGVPTAIAQTTDGYLWFGTPDGLFRFDGARFVAWAASGRALPRSDIHALLGTPDGSLWIGTGRGLARWKNNELTVYPGTGDWVNAIVADHEGRVWIARSQVADTKGPLCRVDGDQVQCYGQEAGVGIGAATRLVEDRAGNLWVGGYEGLCRWKPGSSENFFKNELGKTHALIGVEALVAESDGTVWAAIERLPLERELRKFVNGKWSGISLPTLSGTESDISAMFVDRSDTLWIATGDRGIYRVHDHAVDHFASADGLTSDAVGTFFEDREGLLWLGTSKGIDSFRDLRVASFSIREGLTADSVSTVSAAADGSVWIGNSGAINILRAGQFYAVRERHGLPGRNVVTQFQDHHGRLWVGVDSELTFYQNGQFERVRRRDGTAAGIVFAVTEDGDENIWALAGKKLLRVRSSADGAQIVEELSSPQISTAFAMAADPGGGIWLGLTNGDLVRRRDGKSDTFAGAPSGDTAQIRGMQVGSDGSVLAATLQGLAVWKQGSRKLLTAHSGLPCSEIYTLVKDDRNVIWLYTKCGLVTLTSAELNKWWTQPDYLVTHGVLDVFDGVQPGLTPLQPQAAKSADGRLWFANDTTLQMVDPQHIAGNTLPPAVHVEGVTADGKSYEVQDQLRLPPLTRDLQIDYAALSYQVPEKVRYRYMLEGHDREWQDPENRRQAFYNDLSPGKYRFRVIASNNDGVWNEAGATFDFQLLPTFYQTGLFRGLCAIALLSAAWALYLLRMRQITSQIQGEMRVRLGERERIARELHDTLLQSIQGLILRFQVATEKIPASEPSRQMMEKALDRADQVMVEGRDRVRDLRSYSERGGDLSQALYEAGTELGQDSGLEFRVIVEGDSQGLHPIVRDEIYWIGHEALANAFTHAHAKHIEIEMTYDATELRVRFRDDGCGVATGILNAGGRPGHWGLPGMRERALKIGARVAMWSRPEAGTEIELRIPAAIAYLHQRRHPMWQWLRAAVRGGGRL